MILEDLFHPDPEGTDAPRAGTYQLLLRGRPPQPVRILYGPPVDPVTGEQLDRGWRWQMTVNGRAAIFCDEERDDDAPVRQILWTDVWPRCAGDPIPYPEYAYLVGRIAHAEVHDEASPFAAPTRRIDLGQASMPF